MNKLFFQLIEGKSNTQKILYSIVMALISTIVLMIIGLDRSHAGITVLLNWQILTILICIFLELVVSFLEIIMLLIPIYTEFKSFILIPNMTFRLLIKDLAENKLDIRGKDKMDQYINEILDISQASLYINNYLYKTNHIRLFRYNLGKLDVNTLYLVHEKLDQGQAERYMFLKIDSLLIGVFISGIISVIKTQLGDAVVFVSIVILVVLILLSIPWVFGELASKHEYRMINYYLTQEIGKRVSLN